jgi:hypothetical protein
MREGVACWAIDCETLSLCRIKGVKFVGVKLRDQGTLYLTRIDNFYDPQFMKIRNYAKRGGSLQRYVPLECFKVSQTASF